MMSNSHNKATALSVSMLVAAAVAVILVIEPALAQSQAQVQGQGQGPARRDRFRRDTSTSPTSGRPMPGRPDGSNRPDAGRFDRNRRDATTAAETGRLRAAPQTGRITRSAEPNAGRFVDRRPAGPVGKDEQWEKYKVILTRNMFSRERIPERRRSEGPKPVANPESYFLLRGVVQEDNRFIAFVEDKQSGSVLRLHEGDHVARGQVKSLTLDSLEYQWQDKTTPINIGYDLEGGHGAVTASDLANFAPPAAAGAASPAGAPTTQTAAPTAGEEEILKRLMEQRKQQMGQ